MKRSITLGVLRPPKPQVTILDTGYIWRQVLKAHSIKEKNHCCCVDPNWLPVESRGDKPDRVDVTLLWGQTGPSGFPALLTSPGLHFRNPETLVEGAHPQPGRLPRLYEAMGSDHPGPPPFVSLLSGFQLTDVHGQFYDIRSTPDEEEGKWFPQKLL